MVEFRKYKVPTNWQQMPQGEQIQQLVNQQLAPWWTKVFGYNLAKIGELSASLDTQLSSVKYHFSVAQTPSNASIEALPADLPLQSNCIDAVLMCLQLEFEQDPYRVLREIDRVIISGGYLFIVGINPISPMIFGKVLPKYQQQIPWNGQFFMPSRVQDWLGVLGFKVIADQRFVYHHLFTQVNDNNIWQYSLKSWLPSAASLYLIVARKLDSPLTPIKKERRAYRQSWSPSANAGRESHMKKSK